MAHHNRNSAGRRRRRSHDGGRGRRQGRRSRGGGEALQCAPPHRPCRGAAILAEGVQELHRKQRMTNKRQSKVDEGCLSTRGSQFHAPTNSPPKDTICHWDWGEGVAGFDLAQKGRAGDAIIMMWTMTTTTMVRGGSKGKGINDSISEHKCIVTSNIIYSITVIIHTIPDAIRHVVRVCGGCGVLDLNGPEVDCLLCQWGGFVPYWGLRGALIQYLLCKKIKAPKIEKYSYSEYDFLYSVIIILSKL